MNLRGLATVLVVLVVLAGLFFYLVLPAVIEDQVAGRLQGALGLPAEPEVEVSSDFPPEMLWGRIDRIEASADQASLQGVPLSNARVELGGVDVSVTSLLTGDPVIEAETCLLSAEQPPVSIDAGQGCLDFLGLG